MAKKKTKKTSFATKLPPSGKSKSSGKGGVGILKVIVIFLVLFAISILISHLWPPTGSSDTPAQRFSADTINTSIPDTINTKL